MNETQLNYLKMVLISQLLLESNEQLRLTKQFKLDIKNQINKLNVMLENVVRKEFDTIYSTDPEMVTNILNKIENLIDKIKGSSIDELILIDAVVPWVKATVFALPDPKNRAISVRAFSNFCVA